MKKTFGTPTYPDGLLASTSCWSRCGLHLVRLELAECSQAVASPLFASAGSKATIDQVLSDLRLSPIHSASIAREGGMERETLRDENIVATRAFAYSPRSVGGVF